MEQKPIGEVLHYYGHLGVAVVKFNREVKVGEKIHFKGAHTDFIQTIGSIQHEHQNIESAKKGQDVGVKVDEKVREGDEVFEA
jgi:putative protease